MASRPSGRRRIEAADAAAAAYAAAFFLWLAVRTPGTRTAQLIGALAFYPLGLAVAWAGWSNARLPGLDARTRRGWQLLAASSLALWVAGNAGDLLQRLAGVAAEPHWVAVVRLAHSLLLAAACVVFPARRVRGRGAVRLLLDATLIALGGLAVALYFGLLVWSAGPRYGPLELVVAGHAFDSAVFVVAAVGSLWKRDRGTRVALTFWVLGVSAYIAGNYVVASGVQASVPFDYRPGDGVDGLWFLAWMFRWLGARLARRHYGRAGLAQAAEGVRSAEYESSRFSYLVVAAAFLLLTGRIFAGDHRFLGVLAVSTATTVVLLLARQVVELRENAWLFGRQISQGARFRSFVQLSSDITLIVSADGRIVYASEAAARTLGAGTPVRAGGRLTDIVRDDDRAKLAAVLAGGPGSPRLVFHLPAPPADWRVIEARWSDLRRDPAIGGFVFNCRDITAWTELRSRLRHAQRLDAVGRLADGLAHEVSNSLTVIRGVADLIGAELSPSDPAAEDLALVRQAVDRAGDLTRRVLAFSRRQPARRVAVDLNALIQQLFPVLSRSVTSGVEVRLTLSVDLWTVRTDPGQIEQVLVNLATNARDAMPDGGRLDIVTANRRVDGGSPGGGDLPPGDYVAVTVSDSGVGMTPEVASRIFEPFFSTKPRGAGMGLGLAMVRAFVRDSGGHVSVESAPGRGTSFTILLPRTLEPAVRAGEAARPAPGPVRARTVLVVDDEPFVRSVTRRILERHGYGVIEAGGGPQALALIGDPAVSFDLLLTDLVMPGVHGRQLIARCRELRPEIPAVCMTGFAGETADPGSYAANLAEVLSKPFTADALIRAVASAILSRSAP